MSENSATRGTKVSQLSSDSIPPGAAIMSESSISEMCKKNGGFRTPELNEQLHLHYKGYRRIEDLDAFTAVKVLWLECNMLRKIEAIGHMTNLSTLYLQQNMVGPTIFGEDLSELVVPSLKFLNLERNQLETLEGIADCFPHLEKLVVSHNKLHSIEGIQRALKSSLTVLDASHNEISEEVPTVAVVSELSQLCSLSLNGNQVVRSMKDYRKKIVRASLSLSFLDESPVDADERRCVDAWAVGGTSAETAERKKIQEEKEAWRLKQTQEFEKHREELRRLANAQSPGTNAKQTEYYSTMQQTVVDNDGDSDDETNLYVPKTTVSYRGEVLGPTTVRKATGAAPKARQHVDPTAALPSTVDDVDEAVNGDVDQQPRSVNAREHAVLSEAQLEAIQKETAAANSTNMVVLPPLSEQDLAAAGGGAESEVVLPLVAEEDINVENLRVIFKHYSDEQQKPVPLMSIFGLQDLLEGTQLLLGGEVDEFVTTVKPPAEKNIEWVDFLIIVEILSVVLFSNTEVGLDDGEDDEDCDAPTPSSPLPEPPVAGAQTAAEAPAAVTSCPTPLSEGKCDREEQIRARRIVATVSTLIELLLPKVLRAKEEGNSPYRTSG